MPIKRSLRTHGLFVFKQFIFLTLVIAIFVIFRIPLGENCTLARQFYFTSGSAEIFA